MDDFYLEVELYHHGFTTSHPNYNHNLIKNWDNMWKINKLVDFLTN